MEKRYEIVYQQHKGYINIYEDDRGWWQVSLSIDNQKNMNYKQFQNYETAQSYISWLEQNIPYHIKKTPTIKTTPYTSK